MKEIISIIEKIDDDALYRLDMFGGAGMKHLKNYIINKIKEQSSNVVNPLLDDVLKKDMQTLFDAIYDLSDIPLEHLEKLKPDILSKLTLILRSMKIAEKHFD